jgi:DNA (cytosine-5)-methyltransferase 1
LEFKLGELFSGPGGLALGAFSASVKSKGKTYRIIHGWASDYDLDTKLTYTHNICPEQPESFYLSDVKKLDFSKLSKIDAFAYGFPCNDFSIVGEKKGFKGQFGPLYTYGLKILDAHKPKFFIAENVGGMSSSNEGQAFKKILDDLEKAGNGYNITVHLYKAEDYGVPQTRHRIIIVGIDKTLGLKFQVPAPTTKGKPVTASKALKGIAKDALNNELTRQSQIVVERLTHIKPGENIWQTELPKHLRLNVKGAKLSQIYRRLHPNKPSYTITGSGGGGTHGYHWKEPRALTNRERARIQTFPDSFEFIGSKESVRKQIGMAVPVELSRIICESILKTFAGIEYDTVPSSFENLKSIEKNFLKIDFGQK